MVNPPTTAECRRGVAWCSVVVAVVVAVVAV